MYHLFLMFTRGQHQWYHFGAGAPPILEPKLVGIGIAKCEIESQQPFLQSHCGAKKELCLECCWARKVLPNIRPGSSE